MMMMMNDAGLSGVLPGNKKIDLKTQMVLVLSSRILFPKS